MQFSQLVFVLVLVLAAAIIYFLLRSPESKDLYPVTGDPLADADFRMAHGEYKKATSLVQTALEQEPQNIELKIKLLEVSFVWGNEKVFLAAAQKYESDLRDAGEWDKVEIMGKQLAPNEFSAKDVYPETGGALADADLRMAYGEYEKAITLVETALEQEPHRIDLKMKLLEVSFVWGNEKVFLAAVRKYESDLRNAGEWDKVEIMGKQLAPNNFSW